MFRLEIRFESSWTNSFAIDNGATPRFTSGAQLVGSLSGLVPVAFDAIPVGAPGSRIAYVQALQALNPDMLYRVPETFDNTVRGVLARLVGEVRRLNFLQEHRPEHLALRAFAKGRYSLVNLSEHSETMTLASYTANEVQSRGAGLVPRGPLYEDEEVSRRLFGHLELSTPELIRELSGSELPEGQWYARSPGILCDRLAELRAEQDALQRAARDLAKSEESDYRSPIAAAIRALEPRLGSAVTLQIQKKKSKELPAANPGMAIVTTVESGACDSWGLAGAVIVAKIRALDKATLQELVRIGVLSKNGNLPGISMTGSIGLVTAKDVFSAASGQRAMSYRLPYSASIPIGRANGKVEFISSGVIVRSGTLVFELEGDEALETELEQAIHSAAVGPFHFGKKGVAYIERLMRRSAMEVSHV